MWASRWPISSKKTPRLPPKGTRHRPFTVVPGKREVYVIVLLSLFACVDADAPIDASQPEPFVFEVPKGATAGGLGPTLVDKGLASSELKWKLFLRQRDASCLKAGRFEVSKAMSMNDLVTTLCGTPLANDVAFTVIEGWRIRDTDLSLTQAGYIEAGAYIAAAKPSKVDLPFPIAGDTLEGYLYPETYMVSPDAFTVENLLERQLATFQERFLVSHTDLGDRTLNEIVIMASMLEREEPKPVNRPLVAGILWKRIDKGWQLGVDATSRYTLKDWNDRKAFLKNLRDENEPYNTRKKKGLPPTAIGSPTVSSLEAAISPKASEYWFYLHDANGDIHPAVDGDGHDRNRKKYDVY